MVAQDRNTSRRGTTRVRGREGRTTEVPVSSETGGHFQESVALRPRPATFTLPVPQPDPRDPCLVREVCVSTHLITYLLVYFLTYRDTTRLLYGSKRLT